MRVFWALVILCALAGGAFLLLPSRPRPPADRTGPAGSGPTSPTTEIKTPPPAAKAEPDSRSVPDAAKELPGAAPEKSGVAPALDAAVPAKPEPAPGSEPVAKATEAPKLEAPKTDAPKAQAGEAEASPVALATDPATFVGPPAPDAAPAGDVKKIGVFDIAPGKIEKKPDGSLLLDDRFTMKGEGTADNPYEITWELLTSVEQDFDPHAGKKKVPERIAMLHDKYVKLNGWIAFPLNVQQPRELLLMLNQWDGCCIGVPPTPYDAIEAALTKVVVGDPRFASTGAVTGKFGVKPYIVGDWLVGLYTMENGEFTPKTFSGGGS